jgi:7-cyano-7-deazaguanine synthase
VSKSAIILLSGGLDSATCLAVAKRDGFAPLYTLAFDYGQRHRQELHAAAQLSRVFAAKEHRVIKIDLRQFGHSALTADIDVPKHDTAGDIDTTHIPVTYVPARNALFLTFALAWAEVLGSLDLFIGVNALDYSGYPDCRPEFIRAYETMANLATAMTTSTTTSSHKLTIHTPLLQLTKADIIRLGAGLGVDYSLTHSCYDPSPTGQACAHCDSCLLRKRGFEQAGIPDPTPYA